MTDKSTPDPLTNDNANNLLMANSPTTQPPLLEILAQDEDEMVRRAVTTNPNTPLDTLIQLGLEFPHEFLNNSLFPLLLLAEPHRLQVSKWLWKNLLRCEQIPAHWFSWPRPHVDKLRFQYLTDVKLHVSIAGETNDAWGKPGETDDDTLATLAMLTRYIHPSPDFLLYLAHHGSSPRGGNKFISHIVANPIASPETLRFLVNDDADYFSLLDIAKHKNTPIDVLQNLLTYSGEDERVRSTVFENKHAPITLLLDTLPEFHESHYARASLLSHPGLPDNILHLLVSESWSESIRTTFARDPHTPLLMLHRLLNDPDPMVRCEVAQRKHIPTEFLPALMVDTDSNVRSALARNPHLPTEIFYRLADDSHPSVRMALIENPCMSEDLLLKLADDPELPQVSINRYLAINPHTPTPLLERLLSHLEPAMHEILAMHLRLSQSASSLLFQSQNPVVRMQTKKSLRMQTLFTELHVHMPINEHEDILTRIMQIVFRLEWDYIRRLLLQLPWKSYEQKLRIHNRNQFEPEQQGYHPENELALIETLPLSDELRQILFKELFASSQRAYQGPDEYHPPTELASAKKVSGHLSRPDLSPLWLHYAAHSGFWGERYLVALHPQTPDGTLQQLTHDGNCYVRAAARMTLHNRATTEEG